MIVGLDQNWTRSFLTIFSQSLKFVVPSHLFAKTSELLFRILICKFENYYFANCPFESYSGEC